ncbi:unnamed protein product, partial [marine sediment metagenome]
TTIGFAGRIVEGKGWREFLKAADICMSKKKELHFFNEKDGHGMDSKNQNYSLLGFNWYHSNFTKCNNSDLRGEFSTGYL